MGCCADRSEPDGRSCARLGPGRKHCRTLLGCRRPSGVIAAVQTRSASAPERRECDARGDSVRPARPCPLSALLEGLCASRAGMSDPGEGRAINELTHALQKAQTTDAMGSAIARAMDERIGISTATFMRISGPVVSADDFYANGSRLSPAEGRARAGLLHRLDRRVHAIGVLLRLQPKSCVPRLRVLRGPHRRGSPGPLPHHGAPRGRDPRPAACANGAG